MENFIDSFFLSPSWIDVNASTSPSWVESIASQTDSFLSDSIESYEGDGKSLMPIITSSHITGNVPAEGLSITHDNKSSIFTDGRLKHDVINQLFLGENLSQIQQPNDNSSHVIEVHEGSFSLPISVARSSAAVSYDLESNASLPNSTLTISSSLEGNGSEPPAFGHSIEEVPYIPSVPTIWSPSHSVISSLPGQGKTQTKLSPNVVTFASGQQIKITSEISHPPNQGTMELPNLQLPSFYGGSQMSFSETIGMQDQQSEGIALKPQICHSSSTHPHMTYTNDTGCDVAAKPRVRARRGQATDPHSIAERLRREKIAERMKNLQELVPSSNKTDKASMLDEIIDYVKFLQLQVKVLSMSRLGAASASVPPIIDVQEEDIESFLLSPIYQGVDEEQQPQDNLAFEREVVKLMDSNVTIAMQYLQNKGLCLMPIALATAISDQKDCTAAIPPDRRRPDASERNHQGDELNHINHIIVKQEHQVNR